MDQREFDEGLSAKTDEVFQRSPDLLDHRKEHPWLTGGLGDPFSRVWFIAEFPSLKMIELARNPDGAPPTPEAQWYASNGDKLFRKALVSAGFKKGEPASLGGWNCYITNIIKEADYASSWEAKTDKLRLVAAKLWAPVFDWQMNSGKPMLIVLMGKKVAKLVEQLGACGDINLPKTASRASIDIYTYVANFPKGNLPRMAPERVRDYIKSIDDLNGI